MKRVLVGALLAALLVPGIGYAGDWKHGRGHGYGRHSHGKRVVVIRDRHHDGTAILAGVLGGIATGVILERVLTPPPAPQPVYDYPPPPRRDPYDHGYSDGYSQGVERGRQERYEQGRRRGYNEGYDDARSGRIF